MKNIYNAHKQELVTKTAEELKKIQEIDPPVWSEYVKTGAHKQRPPAENDWWYTRTASVLLKTMGLGPIGISKLRTKYGGRKRRGHKPPEFRKGSGNILRKIMQQLEKAGLVKQVVKSGHKGRIIAPKGISLLNAAAKKTIKTAVEPKSKPLAKPKPEEKEPKPEKNSPKPKEALKPKKPAEKTEKESKEEPKKAAEKEKKD